MAICQKSDDTVDLLAHSGHSSTKRRICYTISSRAN